MVKINYDQRMKEMAFEFVIASHWRMTKGWQWGHSKGKELDDQRDRGLRVRAWYVLEVANSPVRNGKIIKITECHANSLDLIL